MTISPRCPIASSRPAERCSLMAGGGRISVPPTRRSSVRFFVGDDYTTRSAISRSAEPDRVAGAGSLRLMGKVRSLLADLIRDRVAQVPLQKLDRGLVVKFNVMERVGSGSSSPADQSGLHVLDHERLRIVRNSSPPKPTVSHKYPTCRANSIAEEVEGWNNPNNVGCHTRISGDSAQIAIRTTLRRKLYPTLISSL